MVAGTGVAAAGDDHTEPALGLRKVSTDIWIARQVYSVSDLRALLPHPAGGKKSQHPQMAHEQFIRMIAAKNEMRVPDSVAD